MRADPPYTEPDSAGFALVEVLVALAICAVALTTLIGIFADVARSAADNRARSIGEMHMASLIAQTEVLVSENTRELSDELPDGYSWHISSAPITGQTVRIPPGIVVRKITYEVSWPDGPRRQSLSLTSERILRP